MSGISTGQIDSTLSRLRVAVLVIAGGIVLAVAWSVTPDIPRLDDGFISLHSAQSLMAGHDSHYGSPPLTGVTSPPYTLLIAGLLAIGVAPLVALKAATALGLAAVIVSLWILARAMDLPAALQPVLPLAVLVAGPVAQQATNGVETGWAMAVGILAIAFALRKRRVAVAIAASCLPWLRPDLAPMAGLLFVWTMWKGPARSVMMATSVAACVFVGWEMFLFLDSGVWVPKSMAAKTAFSPEWCLPAMTRLGIATSAVWQGFLFFLPMSALGAAWLVQTSVGRLGVAAVVVSLAAYVVIWPSALWFNSERYLYAIVIPWLSLGLATLLRTKAFFWRAAWAGSLVASLIVLPRHQLVWFELAKDRVDAAVWMRDHIDRRETILVQDAGVPAVFTDNPLVDFVGLKSPSSLATHQAITWPTCGVSRSKAIAEIARRSGAHYLFITQEWDRTNALTAGLRSEGFDLEEIRQAPVVDGYEVFRIRDRSRQSLITASQSASTVQQ